MPTYTLAFIAERIGGRVLGNGDVAIRGVSGIKEAQDGELTSLHRKDYAHFLDGTGASAVILGEGVEAKLPAIVVHNPQIGFAQAAELFRENLAEVYPPGEHNATACVAASAKLADDVYLGAHVVIEDDVIIGSGCRILHGAVIHRGSRIGSDVTIHPGVVIRERTICGDRVTIQSGAVIGSDGFGFIRTSDGIQKFPQLGHVLIEDDVEIGANVCIDRAATGATRIGAHTKIDNLVQIGHNVSIGPGSILCAQVGISGSTTVGTQVTVGGQAGVVGHIRIGDRANVGAQAGVTRSVPEDEVVSGYPARPHRQARRYFADVARLPNLLEKMRELTQRVAELEEKLGEKTGEEE
ncbi:MAG: UDP-3-O-(3-hydroxymyristoyl)glucosamine N-acyltransferase [Planctomycetota bacterium]